MAGRPLNQMRPGVAPTRGGERPPWSSQKGVTAPEVTSPPLQAAPRERPAQPRGPATLSHLDSCSICVRVKVSVRLRCPFHPHPESSPSPHFRKNYSHALHNDTSVTEGPHVGQWPHKRVTERRVLYAVEGCVSGGTCPSTGVVPGRLGRRPLSRSPSTPSAQTPAPLVSTQEPVPQRSLFTGRPSLERATL